MADTKTTGLTANTTPAGTDLLYMVDDPGGSALSQKITIADMFKVLAYTSFTPTLTQPTATTVTKTVTQASWVKIGYHYHIIIRLDVTGAGTGNNIIEVGNLPAAPAGTDPLIGNYLYYDNGTGFYSGAVLYITASSVLRCYTHGLANELGKTPNFAMANGDVFWLNLKYAT